jgi:hypothetical protein
MELDTMNLLKIWKLYRRSVEVLGTHKKAFHWCFSGNRAMKGYAPVHHPDWGLIILERIEYGIFS